MDNYEYGVAYVFDDYGAPLQRFVEPSDDEQDARSWAQASGDPLAKVVRCRVGQFGEWAVF